MITLLYHQAAMKYDLLQNETLEINNARLALNAKAEVQNAQRKFKYQNMVEKCEIPKNIQTVQS